MKLGSIKMRPLTVAQGSRGALTPHMRTRGVVMAYWQVEASFVALEEENWRELSAFVSRLDGQRNRTSFYDVSRPRPLGGAFGTPTTYQWEYNSNAHNWEYDGRAYQWQAGQKNSVWLASAARRGAEKITLGGLTASTIKAVKRGDLLGIAGNIYEAVTEANSDANGEAGVTIRPRLRKPAAAKAHVQVDKPRGRFTLAGMDVFDNTITPPTLSRNASISFVEAPDLEVAW